MLRPRLTPLTLAGLLILTACAGAAPISTPASPTPTATLPPEPTSPPPPTPTASPTPDPTPPPPIAWALLAADGTAPAAREDHTWRVDPDGTSAYLFGGRDGTAVYDGLWRYDLPAGTWTQLEPSGPAPEARFGHEAAWVDGIGLVIFAGQQDGTTFFNDLWADDPETNAWRELRSGGAVPAKRYGTCAAIGPDGRLWISHGFTQEGTRFSDTRAYDFATGAWTDETPAGDVPIVRCLHGCWWTDAGSFVLYAGQTTGVTALGDLWQLRTGDGSGGHAWRNVGGELPAERNLYAATRIEGATIVFGGQLIDGSYDNGLWRFDDALAATEVTVEGGAPPGRSGAELVRDAERGRLLLFGGKGADGAFGDLWELSLGE